MITEIINASQTRRTFSYTAFSVKVKIMFIFLYLMTNGKNR